MKTPILIKAGDKRVKLGYNNTPPRVDCRVIAEDLYKTLYTEQECREMILEYANFVVECMFGKAESQYAGDWFEENKKQ